MEKIIIMKESPFITQVIDEYKKRSQELPYQINLLEEVHMHDDGQRKDISGARKKICENAHTRILEKLLRFRSQEGNMIFKSLVEYIRERVPSGSWSDIIVNTPSFESEHNCEKTGGRIDLLVWENNKYAIILENKINDAKDEEHQIARYISQLCYDGFPEERIYVLYLSSEGIKSDIKQTWQLEDGKNYKESFQSRFFDFSYRYEVLPWLTDKANHIIESLPGQDFLSSAIRQYIDYLRGKFGLRIEDATIIKKILENKLEGEGLNEKLKWLDSHIDETGEFIEHLRKSNNPSVAESESLRQVKIIQEGLYSLKLELIQNEIHSARFPIYEKRRVYERICHFGFDVDLNGRHYLLYIGQHQKKFFTSVISIPTKNEKIDNVSEQFFQKLEEFGKKYHDWRASSFTPGDYDKAIKKMVEVLKSIPN